MMTRMASTMRRLRWMLPLRLLMLAVLLLVPSACSKPRSKYSGEYELEEALDENGVSLSIPSGGPYTVRVSTILTKYGTATPELALNIRVDNSMRWSITILDDEDLLDPVAIDGREDLNNNNNNNKDDQQQHDVISRHRHRHNNNNNNNGNRIDGLGTPGSIRVDIGMSTRMYASAERRPLEFFLTKNLPTMTTIQRTRDGLLILSAGSSEPDSTNDKKAKIVCRLVEEEKDELRLLRRTRARLLRGEGSKERREQEKEEGREQATR